MGLDSGHMIVRDVRMIYPSFIELKTLLLQFLQILQRLRVHA
jgi:hypothetical protein